MAGGMWKQCVGVVAVACLAFSAVAWAGSGYGVESKSTSISENSSGGVFAKCPNGSKVVGGGFSLDGNVSRQATGFFPASLGKFAVTASHGDGSDSLDLTGYAVCDGDGHFKITSKTRDVADQATRTAKAKCPKGSTVSGGGAQLLDGDFKISRSAPAGARTWAVRAKFFGSVSAKFAAFAICDLDGNDYIVRTKSKTAPPLPKRGANALVALAPKCPSGMRPASGGFSAKGLGTFEAVRSRPDGKEWQVAFETYAGKDLKFTAYAVCGEG